MANPIEQAKKLEGQLGRVLNEIQMAPRWRSMIEEMTQQTSAMIEKLNHIHGEIVPLDLRESAKQHAENFEFYNSLPGGRIQKGAEAYEHLFLKSATLSELYRAGFEMPFMTKFSKEELTFAKELGEGFQNWHDAWHLFKLSEQYGEHYKVTKAVFAKEWNRYLQLLKKWGVITDYKAFSKDWKKKAFVAAKMYWILKRNPNDIVRFEWEKGKSDFDALISGHWFSAFAYSIIVDHLRRLGSDYETYTLVRYIAPREVKDSSGDLDVVARAGGKILMIECKSGSLKRFEDRDDFAEVINKAEALREVFVQADSEIIDYTFWLVYNPYLNDPNEVARELQDTGIVAVKPEDIRGAVRRCFDLTRSNLPV